MNRQQVNDVALRFISRLQMVEASDGSAVDHLVDLFADDASLLNPLIQDAAGARTGREAVTAFWRAYRSSFRAIRSDFVEVTSSERAAALFWHAQGTGGGGQPVDYDGVTLLRLDEAGRIARMQAFFDRQHLTLRAPQPV